MSDKLIAVVVIGAILSIGASIGLMMELYTNRLELMVKNGYQETYVPGSGTCWQKVK